MAPTISSSDVKQERRRNFNRRASDAMMPPRRMRAVEWIPMLLLAVGGLNWGLIGLFDYNLVSHLLGNMTTLSRVVYIAVGVCALYALYLSGRMSGNRRRQT